MKRLITLSSIAAFAATIPIANWLIQNVGTKCVPDGPCLIPVWPEIYAPSGVLMIGVALCLRDLVHRYGGTSAAILAIAIGGAISFYFAPASLAMASTVAFMLSELADTFVYAPLYRKRLIAAVAASSVVGAFVDSAVFLWLAFGSLAYMEGQVIGKLWAALAAITLIHAYRMSLKKPV